MENGEDLFIERINIKQKEAYHELFQRFYQSLVMFAMHYVIDREEAEDIVQDLFLGIWEKEDKFLSYVGFRVFLYRSVRNNCLNRIKHHKVEKKYIDYSLRHSETMNADDLDIVEEEAFRLLFEVIDELPPRCRQIFQLYLEGKKNEEIGELLEISLFTVKTQKKKAFHYIRKRMGHLFVFFLLGV